MEYNDFSILTDSEYIKLAEQYNTSSRRNNNEFINIAFYLIEKSKNFLYSNNVNYNQRIRTELNTHLKILTKLSNNFKLMFSTKENNINNYNNFNLFTYLSSLLEIQNHLNNWLIVENTSNYKKFILNSKNELHEISISILNILSKTNIHFFKYM